MSTFSEGNLQYPRNVSYNFSRYEDTTPVRVEAEGKRYVGQLLNHEPPYRVRVTEEIVTPGSARFIPVREIQLQSLDGVEYLHKGHHAH